MIKSDQFNDVYFSADGGADETRHVFIAGNNLPQAWQGKDSFTIAETGFGTGLNFLVAWKLFEQTTNPDQRLHFISVEKYPLSKSQIKEALSEFGDEFDGYLDRYLDLYPIRVPGPHNIHLTNSVTLTLWFGDIVDVMSEWMGRVDAWFLDGFTPAKNPDMWSDAVFENMNRLSHFQTTYATFTAAGDVRRGLERVGFSVEKTKGFGRKRDMVKGQFKSPIFRGDSDNRPKSIAIIGGGLAGCAMAYTAHRMGVRAIIYEAGDALASGASGGKLGMVNPKLTAKRTAQSDYYAAAYAHSLRVLSDIDDVDFQIHGSVHKCTDADKHRRFTGYIENLGWHADHIQRLENGDLWYPDGASISPYKLCHALARHAEVRLNHTVESCADIDADYIILANGYDVNKLLIKDIPVSSIRGQVSWVKPQSTDPIIYNVCYGGYATPQTPDGVHIVGSTFQPWDADISVTDSDHQDNINKYNRANSGDLKMNDVVGGWTALRTASKDRFPIVGHVRDNIYISTAHGSHGIISGLMAADIIAGQLFGQMSLASADVLSALSPKRFRKH